jgi:hypothetical protein
VGFVDCENVEFVHIFLGRNGYFSEKLQKLGILVENADFRKK